jgi:hypothetical protein
VVPYLASTVSSLPSSSGHYTVSVSGTPVPVFSYGGHSFAWFAFSGSVNVAVTYSAPISSYTLSPIRARIASNITGGKTVNFSLSTPTKACLKKVNGSSEYIYIIADSIETGAPASSGSGIYNVVSQYGADPNYGSEATDAINAAITAATSAGGGIVYVPAGHYKIGPNSNGGTSSIVMASNVSLYLAAGALLEVPRQVACCFNSSGTFAFFDGTNVKIYGRGVIYGNGANQGSAFFWLVEALNETNMTIQGVMLLDSNAPALELQANGVLLDDVKVMTLAPYLNDGVDINSVSNFTLTNSLVLSTDDNTALGNGADNRHTILNMDNINVTNNLFMNTMTGHTLSMVPNKSIPGTYMRNITYNNNDSIDTDAVMAVYPFGGTNMYNITFENFGAENVRTRPFEVWANDCTSWGPGNCGTTNTGAIVLGSVSNVNVTNVNWATFGTQDSQLSVNFAGASIDQIHFVGDVIAGTPITSASAMHLDEIGGPITNVTFSGTSTPPPNPNAPVPNGTYVIKNQYSGLVLDDPGLSMTPGTQVIQWAANQGSNQKWKVTLTSAGLYTLQNMANGLYMTDVSGHLEMTAYTGGHTQLWVLSPSTSGFFTIQSYSTDRNVDDPGLSQSKGTGMITWPPDGGLNQNWSVN